MKSVLKISLHILMAKKTGGGGNALLHFPEPAYIDSFSMHKPIRADKYPRKVPENA